MQTTAVVTAAGNNDRWANHLDTVKHLVRIDHSGESLIVRTVRMLRNAGVDNVFVVTHYDAVAQAVCGEARIIRPRNRASLAESILSSRDYWTDKTMVLLGDVFFSQDCLDRMLACREPLRFFGIDYYNDAVRAGIKRKELYGFTFDRFRRDYVEHRLMIGAAMARFRDRKVLRLSCLAGAVVGNTEYLRLLWRWGYPPKPPALFRRIGFGRNACWKVWRFAMCKPRRSKNYGKLWGLYFDTAGVGLYDGDDYDRKHKVVDSLEVIDDMTQDIDVKEDYYDLLERLSIRPETLWA